MRRYETIFISHPDLSEGDIDNLTQRTTDIIRQLQGEVIQVQQWGKKRLAYQVQKQLRGHYTFLDYACLPKAVLELERILRLDDKVMKYLTVKLEDKADLEAIQRSLEQVREAEVEEEAASSETSPAEQDTVESVGEPKDETPSGEAQEDIPRES